MNRFQNEVNDRVLLMSLEKAASGANLTKANHILFVHPMCAATTSKVKKYEEQAIGRARRYGQEKNEVHVWRFLTLNTLETELFDELLEDRAANRND